MPLGRERPSPGLGRGTPSLKACLLPEQLNRLQQSPFPDLLRSFPGGHKHPESSALPPRVVGSSVANSHQQGVCRLQFAGEWDLDHSCPDVRRADLNLHRN